MLGDYHYHYAVDCRRVDVYPGQDIFFQNRFQYCRADGAILTEKERDINLMKELLEEETMDKARTFSWILSEQPQLLTNSSKLMKLCESMGLDELHIIDEKGIITSSTIRAYVGFDMASGKQSAEFLKILEDASFELARRHRKIRLMVN